MLGVLFAVFYIQMTPSVSDGRPITKYFSVSTSNHRASRQTTVVSFRRLDVVMENLKWNRWWKWWTTKNNNQLKYIVCGQVCVKTEKEEKKEKKSVVLREHTSEIEMGN